MVKAIEHIMNDDISVRDDFFRIEPNFGLWNFPIYSYARNAKNPIVIYRHNSKMIHPIEGLGKKRRLKYCTMFIFFNTNLGFFFDNIIYYPSRGDVLILKNEDEFSSYFNRAAYENSYEIDFPLDFFECMQEDSVFHKLFYGENSTAPNIISTDSRSCEAMIKKLDKLEEAILSDDENKDIIAYSYIIQTMGIIHSQISLNKEYLNANKIPAKLKTAITYINQNFTTLENIEDVAANCGVTSTYLARMFRNIIHCTPNEYVTNLRISYAQKLLSQGASITDACYASGFNNYTYFISKFKSITGNTPSKFRKKD